MTAKEYLEQVRKLDLQINANMQEACNLRRLAERAKSVFCGDVKSSAVEDALVQLTELENAIVDDIHRIARLRDDVRDIIKSISVPEERMVLQLRYLCGKKWEEIAVEMSYSWKQIHRIHSRSLKSFEKRGHTMTHSPVLE